MPLILVNGSPRGRSGNSRLLLEAFRTGFLRAGRDVTEVGNVMDLATMKDFEPLVRDVQRVDAALIAFPLYVDSMPALVKLFFESLEPVAGGASPPQLGFVIQSGFPESVQSFPLERYLQKLCTRLGYGYLGTVIKGGVEVIRIPTATASWFPRFVCWIGAHTNLGGVGHLLHRRRLLEAFEALGAKYSKNCVLDDAIIARLRSFKQTHRFGFFLYKWIGEHFYWNALLRQHGVLLDKDARPFENGSVREK